MAPLMVGMAFTASMKGYAAGNPVLDRVLDDAGACAAAIFAAGAA